MNYDNTIRAGRIIFLRWQISCGRKKERNAKLWKARREKRTLGRKNGAGWAKRRSVHANRAEVRKTTTGLFFLHPVWITIIPPSIVYCGGELFYYRSVGRSRMLSERGVAGRRRELEGGAGGKGTTQKNDHHAVYSRFRDLLILRRKTTGLPRKTRDNLPKKKSTFLNNVLTCI